MCSFIISSYYSSWSLLTLLLVTTSLLCFSLGSLGTLFILILVSALELSQSYALSTVLRLLNLLGVVQSSFFLPISPTYAKHLIHMQKADNAVQVTKSLEDVINQSISSQTVRHSLCKAGIRPVVKKCPLLKLSHRRERLDWAERHKEYTQIGRAHVWTPVTRP